MRPLQLVLLLLALAAVPTFAGVQIEAVRPTERSFVVAKLSVSVTDNETHHVTILAPH